MCFLLTCIQAEYKQDLSEYKPFLKQTVVETLEEQANQDEEKQKEEQKEEKEQDDVKKDTKDETFINGNYNICNDLCVQISYI